MKPPTLQIQKRIALGVALIGFGLLWGHTQAVCRMAVSEPVLTETERDRWIIESRVELNTADRAALCTIPGIGEILADRIVQYRASHLFTVPEDLLNVDGISPALLDEIRTYIRMDPLSFE